MNSREAVQAWRLFELNWIPLGLMTTAFALAMSFSDFSVGLASGLSIFGFVAIYGGFAYYNAKAPHRRDPQVVFVLGSTAQIALATVTMAPLTYVAAATNFPMQDANLLAIDRALGLDWLAFISYVNERPLLATWLNFGYSMIKWPIFLIPVVLAIQHRYCRIQEFTLSFALALVLTTIISAFVPAIGVFQQLGLDPVTFKNLHPQAYLDQLRDLPMVRDGSLRHLDLFLLAGVVTFPSFHAASAILYIWAFWPVWWMRPVAVLANGAMLVSTPVDGGHYFIDVFAGIAVAIIAIAAAKWIGRKVARQAEAPVFMPAPQPAE
jgi:hypothetical protein